MSIRFVYVLLLAAAGSAQTFRGTIQGSVADSSGAAVPNAEVTVTNTDTGLSRATRTDDDGNYFFNELPLGAYRVTAARPGFAAATVAGVQVAVADPAAVSDSPGASPAAISPPATTPPWAIRAAARSRTTTPLTPATPSRPRATSPSSWGCAGTTWA